MKFKPTFKALLAALSFGAVASDEEAPLVTEERLEQLNASLDSANQSIAQKDQEIAQLKQDLQGAKDAQSTAERDRDEWKGKAEKYAKGPGASHFVPNTGKAEGGNEGAAKTEEEIFRSFEHNQKALDEISKFS